MVNIFLVGFGFGLAVGLLLLFIVWQDKQRIIDELTAKLKTPLGDLVTKRQR